MKYHVLTFFALCLCLSRDTQSQVQFSNPLPGERFVFDELVYNTPLQNLIESNSQPTGSIFGNNPWYTGSSSDVELQPIQTRGWYAFMWPEYRDWYMDSNNCINPNCTIVDGSVMDSPGAHLSSISKPGQISFAYKAGTYTPRAFREPWITSGFTHQEGTWLARVRLPKYTGLRFHPDNQGIERPASLISAFWLQGSEFYRESRGTAYTWGNPNITHMWSEVNFEINNWFDPDGLEGHRAMSTGISWGSPFSSIGPNPPLGTSQLAGRCYTDAGSIDFNIQATNPSVCFDIMTNKFGTTDLYVYMMIRISNGVIKYWIVGRDERPDGIRDGSDNFPSFDWFSMESEPNQSYAQNSLMRAVFDLGLTIDSPNGTDPVELNRKYEMLADWFFYTENTIMQLWDLIEHVNNLRTSINQYNANTDPSNRVYRINTTESRTEFPYDVLNTPMLCSDWFNRTPDRTWQPALTISNHNGVYYASIASVRSTVSDTRHATFRTLWTISRRAPGGVYNLYTSFNDHSFATILPMINTNHQWKVDVVVSHEGWDDSSILCNPDGGPTSITLSNVYHNPESTPTELTETPSNSTTLYPNPATSNIHFGLFTDMVRIHDMTGRAITTTSGGNVQIEHLSPGTYIICNISIENNTCSTFTKR